MFTLFWLAFFKPNFIYFFLFRYIFHSIIICFFSFHIWFISFLYISFNNLFSDIFLFKNFPSRIILFLFLFFTLYLSICQNFHSMIIFQFHFFSHLIDLLFFLQYITPFNNHFSPFHFFPHFTNYIFSTIHSIHQ